MVRGNPHPHRYKYGKVEKAVSLDVLRQFMERVEKIDRLGYGVRFVQALLAIAYWTGFRRSEVIGDSGLKWKVKSGELRHSAAFPGLLKENVWVDEGHIYFRLDELRKHSKGGTRVFPLSLAFMDLIVERWKETKDKERLFPIDESAQWRIFKNIDPKLYWHVFCFTRMTKLAEDKDNSLADIVRFSGKNPVTVAWYMDRVGRSNREIGDRMQSET
jgi:hypothetical protein